MGNRVYKDLLEVLEVITTGRINNRLSQLSHNTKKIGKDKEDLIQDIMLELLENNLVTEITSKELKDVINKVCASNRSYYIKDKVKINKRSFQNRSLEEVIHD